MIEFIACCASIIAGLINAVAGGGTLISFPALLALGIHPVSANVTNTLALCPGYFGGLLAQRKEFPSQKKRLLQILPISIIGGLIGGYILIHTEEKAFTILVPYLILVATLLLAIQVPLKKWVQNRSQDHGVHRNVLFGGFFLLFFASVYGGYFGAGASVIIIAVLGLVYDDSLARLNVLKLAISFSVNITAAIYFIFNGTIEWFLVLVMSVGSIFGGAIGGVLVERINPDLFRGVIIGIGILIAISYLL